jgi:hypothetical protein
MRYFKYKHANKIYSAAWKAEFAHLARDEQKIVRKNRNLGNAAVIVMLIVMSICFACGVFALKEIPDPEHILLRILYYMMIPLLAIVWIALSGVIGYWAARPLFNRITEHPKLLRQNALHRACEPLRKFYGLQEPFVVTKCFSSSDETFNNHDVCLFVCDGELRITADIQRGFADGNKDLGCYAFRADEITLTKREREGSLALELKADQVVFLLGYRAKGYIRKHFLNPQG